MKELELRMLRRVPAGYRKERIYSDDELKDVDTAYGMDEINDVYHATVNVTGRCASMNDIGMYVKSQKPDADMSCWSMSHTHGGGARVTLNDGSSILLGQDVIKSLEMDHISSRTIEICEASWRVEIPYDDVDWLEKVKEDEFLRYELTKDNRAILWRSYYSGNRRSDACPFGYGDEDVIKECFENP